MTDFDGHTPGPWLIATSCSYRRILSERDGGVCEPVVQYSDGHPDLYFRNGGFEGPDARLIAAAPDLLAENKRLRSALAMIREITGQDSVWHEADSALAGQRCEG